MKKPKPIIFCDFDGVLCHHRFWSLLPKDEFTLADDFLFKKNRNLINDWMIGKYTSEQINQITSDNTGIPYEKLFNILVEGCKKMHVPENILKKFDLLREKYIIVLMTGNMDCFKRFTCPALDLERHFDDISNSFYEEMQKTDNGGELFLKYTKKYGVSIKDCICFDDSENVCKVFDKLGGKSYLVTKEKNIEYYLDNLLQ